MSIWQVLLGLGYFLLTSHFVLQKLPEESLIPMQQALPLLSWSSYMQDHSGVMSPLFESAGFESAGFQSGEFQTSGFQTSRLQRGREISALVYEDLNGGSSVYDDLAQTDRFVDRRYLPIYHLDCHSDTP